MNDVSIKIRDNGPYLVRGPVTLTDAEGTAYVVEGDTIALCRCGGSQNKPFCDKSHATNGFDAAGRAPARLAEAE